MTIVKLQESGILFAVPLFLFFGSRHARIPGGVQRVNGWLRLVLAISAISLPTAGQSTSPEPGRLLSAGFSGGCEKFTIAVSGEGLKQPKAIVSYNIFLTPRSGEPLAITDSFEIIPDKNGEFHKTFDATWKKFEFTLTGNYTLSGTAILIIDFLPVHNLAITFPKKQLKCRSKSD